MKFDFAKCRKILYRALMDALDKNEKRIRRLNKEEPIWAISYDIIPWDPYVGIAFRLESETDGRDGSMNSGNWVNSHFIEDISEPALHPAREYLFDLCKENSSPEWTHLIFLAAAEALLDRRVAIFLRGLGCDATVRANHMPSGYFSYIVIDEDGVIKANYCDIVTSNRVTKRVLGKVI